jgi:hypothetical protein
MERSGPYRLSERRSSIRDRLLACPQGMRVPPPRKETDIGEDEETGGRA